MVILVCHSNHVLLLTPSWIYSTSLYDVIISIAMRQLGYFVGVHQCSMHLVMTLSSTILEYLACWSIFSSTELEEKRIEELVGCYDCNSNEATWVFCRSLSRFLALCCDFVFLYSWILGPLVDLFTHWAWIKDNRREYIPGWWDQLIKGMAVGYRLEFPGRL